MIFPTSRLKLLLPPLCAVGDTHAPLSFLVNGEASLDNDPVGNAT